MSPRRSWTGPRVVRGWLVYFGAYTIDVFAASATVLNLLFLSGATELVANNLTPPLMRRFDAVSILYVMLASVAAALLLTGIVVTTILPRCWRRWSS